MKASTWVVLTVIGLSALGLSGGAFAHGESDEEMIAEFYEHLDDFEQEVSALVDQAEAVAAAYAAGQDANGQVDALLELWEGVEVHDVIEVKATIFYPDVWQSMVALKTAVNDDTGAATVAAATQTLRSFLWQSYGGLRLAASQADKS